MSEAFFYLKNLKCTFLEIFLSLFRRSCKDYQYFSKVNCFRVYRKLITWSSHAKSPFFLNSNIWCSHFEKSIFRVQRNNAKSGVQRSLSVISFFKNSIFPYIFCNFDTVELQKMYGKIKVLNCMHCLCPANC